MVARPMDSTVPVGSRTGSSSALDPGTTVGDIHTTDAIMIAALSAGLKHDGSMIAILIGVVPMDTDRRIGAASKDADRAQASADRATRRDAAAANQLLRKLPLNNPIIGSITNGWQICQPFSCARNSSTHVPAREPQRRDSRLKMPAGLAAALSPPAYAARRFKISLPSFCASPKDFWYSTKMRFSSSD